MKLTIFTSCILFSIFVATCTPGNNENGRKVLDAATRKFYRNRYVVEPKKVIEAIPYQEVHARMYGIKLNEFKRWPELDMLDQSELVNYCQKYILCVGSKERIINEDSTLVIRPLQYYYIEGDEIPKIKKQLRKCRLVRMLRCRVINKRIYHFVRGTKQYSAFLVQETSSAKKTFTIVDACRIDVFNTIKSALIGRLQKFTKSTLKRKRLRADAKVIRNAAPYQEIHVNMYGDDLDAYKTWPELEDKRMEELIIVCYKYIECLKLRNSKIIRSRISLSLHMLKYYYVDTTQVQEMHPIYCEHYYPNRLVRTLKCPTNHRMRRFIRASDRYSAFLIEPTNTTYSKFAIARACETDVLNKIGEIRISSYDGNKTFEEYESKDNHPNEENANLFNAHMNGDNSLSWESGRKVSDNCGNNSDAGSQKYKNATDSDSKNDVEMEKGEEPTYCDSEATISDDDMYVQLPAHEYD